jgi:SAM-dependent methyltransferase
MKLPHWLQDNTRDREDQVALRFIQRCAVTKEGFSVLEAGCGAGRFLRKLRSELPRAILQAFDVNERCVRALQREGFDCRLTAISNLPYEDASFDLVHCSHVIEHLTPEVFTIAMNELGRVLRPRGILIIRTPLQHPGFFEDFDHIKTYNLGALMNFFGDGDMQMQSQCAYAFQVEDVWFRSSPWRLYHCRGLYLPGVSLAKLINLALLMSFQCFGLPYSTDGYVALFRKVKSARDSDHC